jgi:hypothetical protein
MPIQILVKSFVTNPITLDVERSELVKTVKRMIEAKEGITVDQQILLFAGEELNDDHTLSGYNIEDRSILHCVIRCSPAKPAHTPTSTPPAIKECHNYVRITGPPELIEQLIAANLEPAKLYSLLAKPDAKWCCETFGTEWVVNEDNSGPPVVHAISNGGGGISSRFVSKQDPPIAFYKLLHKDHPSCSIYYEFNAHHARTVGYGELSSAGSYNSTHNYTTEKQLDDIVRTYHWRLPIAF